MGEQGFRLGWRAALAAVVVAVFGLVCVTGASAFSLGSPKTIGRAGQSHGFPQVAIDSKGRGTVVWHNYELNNGRIEAVQVKANGTVGKPKFLSDPSFDSNNAQVAVDGNGSAVIVWGAYKNSQSLVQMTSLDAQGNQGPVVTLPGEGTDPMVAVNKAGATVVVWKAYDGGNAKLHSMVLPDGQTGTTFELDPVIDTTGDDQYDVSIDSDGQATVMWQASRAYSTVYFAQVDGNGVTTPSTVLSSPNRSCFIGDLQTDKAGFTTLAWTQRSGEVKAARLSPGGSLGKIRTLQGRGLTGVPQIAIDGSNRATIAWRSGTNLLRWVRLSPVGVPGTSGKLRGASVESMAADGAGRVWISWNHSRTRKDGFSAGSIKAVMLSSKSKASRIRTLTSRDEDTYDFQATNHPAVAVSKGGVASFVWADVSRRNARVRMVRAHAGR